MFKKIMALCAGLWCTGSALAIDAFIADELPLQWSSIITLSGGPAWSTGGQNQYLYPYASPAYEYYTYNSSTSAVASAELFFGLQRVVYPNIIGQLGLGVAGVSDIKVSGVTNESGTVDAYSYGYKVDHGRVELKGKLIANAFKSVQPYLSASIGVAFNNSHDYIPVLNNPLVVAPLWFSSNVIVAMPYSFGAGLQTMLNPNWQVGIGYQFADLGKSFLDGDAVYLNKGLRLTHLYTNELLFSLSYLFS